MIDFQESREDKNEKEYPQMELDKAYMSLSE